jgi:trk system potassium uptake protein TrkA
MKSKILKNKTLIVGCSSLGATITNKYSSEGKNLMVIDKNPKNFDRLSDRFSGYTITGDVTSIDVLEEAGIASAKEIVIVTDQDNINIFVAHIARKIYDVPNIYVRLLDPNNEALIKGMDIKAIFPLELSYDKFNILRGGRR